MGKSAKMQNRCRTVITWRVGTVPVPGWHLVHRRCSVSSSYMEWVCEHEKTGGALKSSSEDVTLKFSKA